MSTSKHRFTRTYLVRRIETWEIDLPDHLDVNEWMDADWVAVDETVSDGHLVSEEYDVVDNDELNLTHEGFAS